MCDVAASPPLVIFADGCTGSTSVLALAAKLLNRVGVRAALPVYEPMICTQNAKFCTTGDVVAALHAAAPSNPILISEFGFRARENHGNNTNPFPAGAGMPVATQKQRAAQFTSYVADLMAVPYAVGYHFWKWCVRVRVCLVIAEGWVAV